MDVIIKIVTITFVTAVVFGLMVHPNVITVALGGLGGLVKDVRGKA